MDSIASIASAVIQSANVDVDLLSCGFSDDASVDIFSSLSVVRACIALAHTYQTIGSIAPVSSIYGQVRRQWQW